MSETSEQKTMVEVTEQLVTMNQLLEILTQLNTNWTNQERGSNRAINLREKKEPSKLIYLAISGRGKLNHIISLLPHHQQTTQDNSKWTQQDAQVISWIIENIETELVN